ncbi:peptide-methionine (S)-S-oxide reductase MsrA [Salisaeta longa]|uniref:peptide-methionine (S)-S-oxide reductase MsrA n=1 Tax=Salisaeta longa TaxID=503170 RepID=UPI0003B63BDA|nr:peptide-methionine (S)-S-oxide reductase MsrA [Salisaeta longa]
MRILFANRFGGFLAAVLMSAALLGGCQSSTSSEAASRTDVPADPAALTLRPALADTAVFAGGCFWCMEPPFDKLAGVQSTISGFAGGSIENPSYRQVASGATDHTESVQVVYDSSQVSYEELLYVYWRNVDLLDDQGQFCDRGSQYRPVIFALNDRQARLARASKQALTDDFDQPIVVPVQPLIAFYAAEQYHQNYYKKNPKRYKTYRVGCGRDARLRALWGEAAGGHPVPDSL